MSPKIVLELWIPRVAESFEFALRACYASSPYAII
jgi:hypothetical protein